MSTERRIVYIIEGTREFVLTTETAVELENQLCRSVTRIGTAIGTKYDGKDPSTTDHGWCYIDNDGYFVIIPWNYHRSVTTVGKVFRPFESIEVR